MSQLDGALWVTVVPTVLILAMVYPFRPQGGRMRLKPVSWDQVKTKLALQRSTGELPALPVVRSHRRK